MMAATQQDQVTGGGLATSPPASQESIGVLARRKIYAGLPDDDVALALAMCERYGLDPLLKHVVLIKGRKKQNGLWIDVYSTYITRDGLVAVANQTGVPWAIELGIPTRVANPYTGEGDVYLEGVLRRNGVPDMRAGLWLSEYYQDNSNSWAKFPHAMHAKCVTCYLLRVGFGVAIPAMEEVQPDPSTIVEPTDNTPPAFPYESQAEGLKVEQTRQQYIQAILRMARQVAEWEQGAYAGAEGQTWVDEDRLYGLPLAEIEALGKQWKATWQPLWEARNREPQAEQVGRDDDSDLEQFLP